MTQRFTIAEKVIATLLIIWGCLQIAAVSVSYYYIFYSLKDFPQIKFSALRIIKNVHPVLLGSAISMLAGIFLFLNKKSAWVFATSACLLNMLLYFIPIYKNKKVSSIDPASKWVILILLMALWMASLYVLLLKPVRVKYSVTNRAYIWVLAITVFVAIDHWVVYLTN